MGVSSTQYVCVDSWLPFGTVRLAVGGGGRSLLAEDDGGGGADEADVSLRAASVPYFRL